MAEVAKSVRLSKAAREVNLGIGRVVEFLESKGFDIEAKPNTKLDGEMYQLILQEFADDRDVKKRSQKKTEEEPEIRETVSIETSAKPVRKAKVEEEDVFIKGVQSIAPKPETVVAKVADIKVKVVDKIQLEEKKVEPKAKEPEVKEAKAKEPEVKEAKSKRARS